MLLVKKTSPIHFIGIFLSDRQCASDYSVPFNFWFFFDFKYSDDEGQAMRAH